MNYKKNFAPVAIVAVVVGIILSISVAYFVAREITRRQTPDTSSYPSAEQLIVELVNNWKALEKTIPERPVAGATEWTYPLIIQFISPTVVVLRYEDGHIASHSVFQYESSGFKHLETVSPEIDIKDKKWLELATKYGASNFEPVTYEFSSTREGEAVYPSDWKVVVGNPFLNSNAQKIEYRNQIFGVRVMLPHSWEGYSITETESEIRDVTDAKYELVGHFPVVRIVHPLSTLEHPRQDVPLFIFTRDQWKRVGSETGGWSVGAAPIPPSKLAENSQYVIALPARYNYAFQTGWEEVQKIIDEKSISAFDP